MNESAFKVNKQTNISAVTARLFGLILKLPLEERRKMLSSLEARYGAARREHSRKDYFMTVQYVINDRLYDGFIRNISPSGIFIEGVRTETRGIQINDPVILTFKHPDFSEHVKITGDVVRVNENGVGVSFHQLLTEFSATA